MVAKVISELISIICSLKAIPNQTEHSTHIMHIMI